MKTFKEFFEDFTHYPAMVDPKRDKTKGGWILGDPLKPIVFSDKIRDTKSVLDKANKDIEKARGEKMKPFVESHRKEKNEDI
jgi:hypothetical protein|tara:strand:- start:284 stop:529 length:246 start_codon:yes stop_codon:yes gene_type:complete